MQYGRGSFNTYWFGVNNMQVYLVSNPNQKVGCILVLFFFKHGNQSDLLVEIA
jgi:hypothetical protein